MISVVIPSLGGDLSRTLDGLNFGTVVPDEIIICLPNKSHSIDNLSKYKGIIVIYSGKYSQVFQRLCGFKKSKYEYILQLDDDVYVSSNCLEILIKNISFDKRNISVSPFWLDVTSKNSLFCKKKGLLMYFYYFIINGYAGYSPGKVSLAGTNFGLNFNEVDPDSKLIEVDWQSGGCVLHKRNNLLLYDFYPYKGKAYSEDLIHSILLRRLGVSLFTAQGAYCMTKVEKRLFVVKEIFADFRSRLYFVRIENLSIIRMCAHYTLFIFSSLISRITGEK
ncbi:hypothetical protein HOL24_04155 [bacterium]|nr:hypothetical protein [bacterium]